VDTPGIHKPLKLLNRRIVSYAINTLNTTDFNLWIIELHQKNDFTKNNLSFMHYEDQNIFKLLSGKENRTILVLNKIDKIGKEQLLLSISRFKDLANFAEIVPISALNSTNTERLVEIIKKYLPTHHFYFEKHHFTDSSERFLASEFVREEIFLRLKQEIPYSVAVFVEEFKEDSNCNQIACTICVERESQKGILIGEKGEMLKNIGISARKKIEHLLGNKVNLDLHVKVLKKWSQNSKYLNSLGYH
tara:strand:+ start:1694 stop:2434 length:741 start_codon:yes stop_codon:yes gene_type:complete